MSKILSRQCVKLERTNLKTPSILEPGGTKNIPRSIKPLSATVTLRWAKIGDDNPCYSGLIILMPHINEVTHICPFKYPELAKTWNSPEKHSNTYEKYLRRRIVELPSSGSRSCNKAEGPSHPIPWAIRAWRQLKLRVEYFRHWKGSRRIEYLVVLLSCEVERVAL